MKQFGILLILLGWMFGLSGNELAAERTLFPGSSTYGAQLKEF